MSEVEETGGNGDVSRDADPGPAETTTGPGTADQGAGPLAEALEAERAAHEATRGALTASLASAAGRYREAVLAANPEVPPDLVAGGTVDEVDASLEAARATVAAVLERTVRDAPQVPAGAPVRSGPDTSAMSAAEKIRHGLSRP